MLSHLHFFFLLPLFFSAVFLFLVMNLFTRKLILLDQLTSLLMRICTDKFLLQTEMVKKKANWYTTVQPKVPCFYRVKGHLGGMFLG